MQHSHISASISIVFCIDDFPSRSGIQEFKKSTMNVQKMNVREVCLGQLGQRPKPLKQGLQSPDPYAHFGQLMSGDNALDIDHHGVFWKQILPLLRSPASGGTMSHRQMDCFVGLRPPRNDEGRCNDVFVVSASSRSAEGAVAICPAEGCNSTPRRL